MLSRRLISAAIMISAMLVIVWADYQWTERGWPGNPGVLIYVITSCAVVMAADELIRMWRGTAVELQRRVALTGTLWLIAGAAWPLVRWTESAPLIGAEASTGSLNGIGPFGGVYLGTFLALVWVSFWEIRKFRHDGGGFDRLVRYFFLFGYFGLILGAIPFHRNLFGDNGFGLGSVIAVIATVKMSDAAAYFFGKSLGRHKLAPQISSGKTVEGAVGAFVGGILGAAIVFRWVMPWLQAGERVQSWQWIVLYGCALTLAGMLGDLVESLVKRDAHCKDSSGWLPGLGGILDVVDSLIFAAPASVIVWCCCPQW